MAERRRRRKRRGISQVEPAEQVEMLSQRSFVRARELGRSEPVRVAIPLGALDDGAIGHVDPAGLVQLVDQEWSLDWWIGAEDRWHFASSDATVAQTLMGSSPVVRTTMHVPGGNITHRAFGARASGVGDSEGWSGSAIVVEIENQSAVPVALALVVRPVTLWGEGRVHELAADGPKISVDGGIAAVLSRPIARRVVGPPGTVAIRLDLEDDEQPGGVWLVDGQQAEGAFVVPLPHTAVVRVLLPVTDRTSSATTESGRTVTSRTGLVRTGLARAGIARTGLARTGIARSVAALRATGGPSAQQLVSQWEAPTAEQVEAGWRTVSKNALSISSPEPLFDGLNAITQRLLNLVQGEHFHEPAGGHPAALRNALLCEALVTCGSDEALEPLARALAHAERMSGTIKMDDRSDAVVALLHCAAPLLAGQRSEYWTDLLLGPVAKAVHRLERGRGLGPRDSGSDPIAVRLLRASAALAVARLSPSLDAIGQPEVAQAAHALYHRLADQVEAQDSDSPPRDAVDAGPRMSSVTKALEVRASIADRSPGATDAMVDLASLGHLGVLAVGIDGDGVSDGADPIDPAAMALRLSALVDLLVSDTPTSLVVLPVWPETWFDKPVEVNNVRTRLGLMSFALRWHGNRPVLLWEVEPGSGIDPEDVEPVITAPGLDPGWHAHGWTGESMLAAVEISQQARDAIAERDRPKMAVSLGMTKPRKKR